MDLPDDCWGVIIDAGLSPTDLACLARACKAGRGLVERAAPGRIAVRATPADEHNPTPAPPSPLAWALAPPRFSAVVSLALDLTAAAGPRDLLSLTSALTAPHACARLRDLSLTVGSNALTADSLPHPPVAALSLLPPAGHLTRLALHGAVLDTAGLAGTAAGRGLRALDLDTRHGGPLWRPLYALVGAGGGRGGGLGGQAPAPLPSLSLAAATPALTSLAVRLGSGFGEAAAAAAAAAAEAGPADAPPPPPPPPLNPGLPPSLTSLRLLTSTPRAGPLGAASVALVSALPALRLLDVTNRMGGAPDLAPLLCAAAGGRGEGWRPGGPLAIRLAGVRSPFGPLSPPASMPPPLSPTPLGARLVSLSLGSGRPMSAAGFGGGGEGVGGGGGGAGGAAGPPGLDLGPLAAPGAAPSLADLELRDFAVIAGLPSLAAAGAAGTAAGLTRLALRVHRRFAREGAAVSFEWPVAVEEGGEAGRRGSRTARPPPFAGLRCLEVSLGEVHPDVALVAWAGGRGAAVATTGASPPPPPSLPTPGTPAHAALLRAAGKAAGSHVTAACFISAGARAGEGVVDPFEAGVLCALRSRSAPVRIVSVPDAGLLPPSPGGVGGGGGGTAATPEWAAPHSALRLAFTDAALVAGGLGCCAWGAAPGGPPGVVAGVWGRGGSGGRGGLQAAFFDTSAGAPP